MKVSRHFQDDQYLRGQVRYGLVLGNTSLVVTFAKPRTSLIFAKSV